MHPSPTLSRTRGNLALLALFLATFVLGSTELVIVGVLDLIATDTAVTVSSAGTLVTAYALGLCLGGPALTAATIRLPRRTLLWACMLAFLLATLAMTVTTSFALLLLARAVAGALHGAFVGAAFAAVGAILPAERLGRGIAVVLGGIAVSTAMGVPLGTLIGRTLGWRGAFMVIVAVGAVVLAGLLLLMPAIHASAGGEAAGLRSQARSAFAPRVLVMLAVGVLLLGGQFTVFTYITPFLLEVTGISDAQVSGFLLAYGVATAIGTFAGGWAADRNASRTLLAANIVLVLALGLLYLTGTIPVLAAVALLVWGLVGFGLVPALQYQVATLAGPARDLAASLPASAVNAGIAVGALLGGWALTGSGLSAVVIVGLLMCLVCVPLTWLTAQWTAR
ncbi:MFS transporter [Nonomuraea dietziae]|uniref:DHA1 family inner membrane transport protein n=1 Tax=Nonomuraea dietziae TaxID=65515 RepID=A0A7W5YSR4_9ACTN|nr:MFS transporter [Nonomuraea dietziae]MBB3732712.1 DHA1 family inner membrane transport protein [Nonomuraea dietziae]